jgi:3D (Asp-Asp-Asp) domain-containing protein
MKSILGTIFFTCLSAFGATERQMTPTVYYKPVYNLDEQTCKPSELVKIFHHKGHELATACPDVYESCAIQGSCLLLSTDKVTGELQELHLNYFKKQKDIHTFFETDIEKCPTSFGASRKCLKPFKSVAADPALYPFGTKIYVPAADGVTLPDGSQHDGTFVVEDTGGDIDGTSRFDFYTGDMSFDDPENPFYKIELTNKTKSFDYLVYEDIFEVEVYRRLVSGITFKMPTENPEPPVESPEPNTPGLSTGRP